MRGKCSVEVIWAVHPLPLVLLISSFSWHMLFGISEATQESSPVTRILSLVFLTASPGSHKPPPSSPPAPHPHP